MARSTNKASSNAGGFCSIALPCVASNRNLAPTTPREEKVVNLRLEVERLRKELSLTQQNLQTFAKAKDDLHLTHAQTIAKIQSAHAEAMEHAQKVNAEAIDNAQLSAQLIGSNSGNSSSSDMLWDEVGRLILENENLRSELKQTQNSLSLSDAEVPVCEQHTSNFPPPRTPRSKDEELEQAWAEVGRLTIENETLHNGLIHERAAQVNGAHHEAALTLPQFNGTPAKNIHDADVDDSAACGDKSVQWVNRILLEMWPFISDYACKVLKEDVEPAVQAALPSILQNGFHFEHVDLGKIPLQFEQMFTKGETTQTSEGDVKGFEITYDLVYRGDAHFTLNFEGQQMGVSNFQLKGRLVVEVPQMLPAPPFLNGVSAYFANPPEVCMEWVGMLKILHVSVLNRLITQVIHQKLGEICVLPNRIAVPLAQQERADLFRLKRPRPQGLMRVKLIEAEKLRASDVGLLVSSSDPYVKLALGSQEWRSVTKSKSLSPKWTDQSTEFLVNKSAVQKLYLGVYDEDTFNSDDFLGGCTLEIEALINGGGCDVWLDLEDDGGEAQKLGSRVHIQTEWRRFIVDADVAKVKIQDQANADTTCFLFVGIYGATGLPPVSNKSVYWVEVGVMDKHKRKTPESIIGSVEGKAVAAAHALGQSVRGLLHRHVSKAELEEQMMELPSDFKATAQVNPKKPSIDQGDAARLAKKIKALHAAQVDTALIAETLDCSIAVVQQYCQGGESNSELRADLINRDLMNVTWEQGFDFILSHPDVTVAFQLKCVRPDSTSPEMIANVQYKASELLEQSSLTAMVDLPLPKVSPDASLSVRMQLRCISQD